ncbi:cysteine desulfurase [Leptospira tipperaryensis]|uniref:Cysteine desulfurase n=1 Tax=Leptospira tipperaryensis TaxID=2564040 RepID=A0A1D7UW70_9LEPT|nr:family 2A encapsulin nanocompartment cargo protein cysteine desulfurase [Leptospira tipperaryensis]AOP33827.1 cysteine desulfurase [Leptospira tipperaryensis]
MSTSDPFSTNLSDFSDFGKKDLQGLIDPSVIASLAGELFGPLPTNGGVDELILSNSVSSSKPTTQSAAPIETGKILQSGYGLDVHQSDYKRIPEEFLPGASLPSFPGSLTSTNVGVPAPTFSTSFSFLEDIRSFVPQAQGIQINDPFRFQPSVTPNIDISSLKKDFPILKEKINGRDLVWLDNAATTHKPQSVIDRISAFYEHENSNIHRGAHTLAARATDAYEAAREKTAGFLNASSTKEIVFVRGATEAINLVAQTWGAKNIGKDDEIIITWLEHHANIVPWQMLCAQKGARLKVVPVDDLGQVILTEYERLLSPRTKLVSLTQVSNALGTVTPAAQMVAQAHHFGAKVLVDGAQAVSHMPIDVQALDCDFYVFSGHKVFAPTGIGVLFGKSEVLESMPPWQGGGNMIEDVTFEKTVYQSAPFRFEAGTGNIADAVGLGAAIDYLNQIGMQNVADYEHSLLEYGTSQLQRVPGLRLIGTAKEKAGVLSFVLDGFKTEDVGRFLNQEGIAVRSGHHCAQPILRRFGLESTVRPSLALYNTCEDIDALINALFDLRGGRTAGPL